MIKRYDYEPYGTLVGGQVTDGPGYTGHVSDSTTGLSYMQQRYMDPELGVFLSVDPVSAYDQPVGQFNRYRYANGNPYKFTDPDGRNPALPFIYGAIAGPVNIAIQKLMNPDKPIDQTQALIAAGVGSVSGGVGGIAVAAVESGVISVGRAVAIQAAANFVTGGAGAAAETPSRESRFPLVECSRQRPEALLVVWQVPVLQLQQATSRDQPPKAL